MIDEDSISVVITAGKEIDTSVGIGGYGGSSGNSPLSSASVQSSKQKYTVYTVFVRNRTTGGKFVVKRRYSDFYKLRKELMEFVSWGHCAYCDRYLQQIAEYPFPRRRLLRSSRTAVVKERMDSLGLFLRHLLLCIMAKSFNECTQAKENIENCILKSFLQIDQVDQLFPNMSSKQQRQIEIMHALEEKRQQRTIELRTKSLGLTAQADGMETARAHTPQPRSNRQVGPDTCHLCLQKWTNCYCNGDQDSVYPVNVHAANVQANYHQPYGYDYSGDEHAAGAFPSYHHYSYASDASEASRCSRCNHDWDNCYCCQQISPTASSVCTDA